jgi:hypothetical protein
VLFASGQGDWLPGSRIDDAYAPIQEHKANFRTRTVD